jgi:hypothetical protein
MQRLLLGLPAHHNTGHSSHIPALCGHSNSATTLPQQPQAVSHLAMVMGGACQRKRMPAAPTGKQRHDVSQRRSACGCSKGGAVVAVVVMMVVAMVMGCAATWPRCRTAVGPSTRLCNQRLQCALQPLRHQAGGQMVTCGGQLDC